MLKQFSQKRFTAIVVLLAIVITAVTAYKSIGFYHPDEHYQIIEFAGTKLGWQNKETLPWEYTAQIRTTIQPSITATVFYVLNLIHITDPYQQAFILRFLCGIFCIFVLFQFYKNTIHQFNNLFLQRFYLFTLFFLWYIPFLCVRFSSETMGAMVFMLALTKYLKHTGTASINYFIIGLLCGMSFLFRQHMAFAIIPFIIWLLVTKKTTINNIFILIAGIVILLICGLFIDRWFYGNWVFAPYQYFLSFINTPSRFGTEPWYYYLYCLFQNQGQIVGLLFYVCLIIVTIYQKHNLIIWIFIGFVFFHSILGHKEDRFLFPVAFLIPYIIIFGLQIITEIIKKHKAIHNVINILFITVICSSAILGITAMASKGAGLYGVSVCKKIKELYPNKAVHLHTISTTNPYFPSSIKPMLFYANKQVSTDTLIVINNQYLFTNDTSSIELFTCKERDLTPQLIQLLALKKYKIIYQSIPNWILHINKMYKGFSNDHVYYLYLKNSN